MRENLRLGGVGLLAIVCCAALPLIVTAGVSLVALAWGGAVLAAAVVIAGIVFIGVRRHAARTSAPDSRADVARNEVE